MGVGPSVERLEARAYTVPTERPESDGTLRWDATTIVIVHAHAGSAVGLGYSYTHAAAVPLIRTELCAQVVGASAFDLPRAWHAMVRALRNLGRPGLCSTAIAAVDVALHDLKARLLGVSLLDLLGAARDATPIYGSGGFTSYTEAELCAQLASWVEDRVPRVKMKVGREPREDLARVAAARAAIGDAALFVDANGAYDRKQALELAGAFSGLGVSWFEEPVPSDDLEGLRLLRDRAPAGMEITAGEYGYDAYYFARMLRAGAVDVLMPDVTRCAGITGFLAAAALCHAANVPLSAHCAPSLSAHVCCAALPARHVEYFHDHVLIERLLLDGVLAPRNGTLAPDRARPGHGLELRTADAERYRVA